MELAGVQSVFGELKHIAASCLMLLCGTAGSPQY